MLVRDPSALGPAVVEVEHGGDGIHAQPVDAVAIEPEQSAGQQEICDLDPPVIVDQRVPVEVAALLRIFVLIERRSVETAESMRIVGEMPGNPIEDDGEALAVACIDQGGKIGRSAEAAGGSEQSGGLIAPGSVERMLADRQEFDMGESQVACIGGQFLRQLAVGQPTAVLCEIAGATTQMHFVDRYRCAQGIDARQEPVAAARSCPGRPRSKRSAAATRRRMPADRTSTAACGRRAR